MGVRPRRIPRAGRRRHGRDPGPLPPARGPRRRPVVLTRSRPMGQASNRARPGSDNSAGVGRLDAIRAHHDPAALEPASLGDLAVVRAASWREFLVHADDRYLRACPDVAVFSPMQYGAHVRDILRVYTDRIVLGREQDSPTVPIFNPPHEEY